MAPQTTAADPAVSAPAPWVLKGRAWILPYWAPQNVLPGDAYPVGERGTPYADEDVNGRFQGKMGYVQILRYTETDVGPYDEVLFIPGAFSNPITEKVTPRITTIYVSTEASVRNGRRNWSIPKYIANFQFTPVPGSPAATQVEISLPSNPSKPFFKAILTPARYVPSVPLSSRIPLGSIVQPPIPSPTDSGSMLLGCPDWIETVPALGGWLRLVWPQPALPPREDVHGEGKKTKRYGDGEHFADFQPTTWALELMNFSGVFPVGTVVSAEDSKRK